MEKWLTEARVEQLTWRSTSQSLDFHPFLLRLKLIAKAAECCKKIKETHKEDFLRSLRCVGTGTEKQQRKRPHPEKIDRARI